LLSSSASWHRDCQIWPSYLSYTEDLSIIKNMQKATLPRVISIVSSQERCEQKGARFEATLNVTIMVNLVRHIMDIKVKNAQWL